MSVTGEKYQQTTYWNLSPRGACVKLYVALLMLISCYERPPFFCSLIGCYIEYPYTYLLYLGVLCCVPSHGLVEPKGYTLKIANFCQLVPFSFIVFILHFPNPWKSCACFHLFIGHLYYHELPILIVCSFFLFVVFS